MDCARVREHISAYQDQMLPDEEARRIDEHLEACGECREYFDEMKKMLACIRDLGEVEPPRGMTREVMERVRAGEGHTPGKGILRWLFYPLPVKLPIQAAITILIAVSVLYIYKTMQPDLKISRVPTGEYALDKALPEKEKTVKEPADILPPPLNEEPPVEKRHGAGEEKPRKVTEGSSEQDLKDFLSSDEPPVPAPQHEEDFAPGSTPQGTSRNAVSRFRSATAGVSTGSDHEREVLVVRVSDIRKGSESLEEAILELDGRILVTVSSSDRAIFTVEIGGGRMQELIERLEEAGEVSSGKIMHDPEDDGDRRLEIQITQ